MFHILGIILFVILFVLLISFTMIYKVVRTVMGFGKRKSSQTVDKEFGTSDSSVKDNNKSKDRKKIFDDSEGEYIEFEEIKD